jgi:hypothetical protein
LSSMLPTHYANDESCTSCHRSGSMPTRLANAASTASEPHDKAIGLACESCHGPAMEHVRFNRRFISGPPLSTALEQTSRALLRQTSARATCIQCHVNHGHKQHPPYEKPAAQSVPSTGAN